MTPSAETPFLTGEAAMSNAICSRCGGPVGFMNRELTPGSGSFCPNCIKEFKREEQAAHLQRLRQAEDAIFAFLLAPFPPALRAPLARPFANPRVRGLTKLVGGLAFTPLFYLVAKWLADLTGVVMISAVVAAPLVVALIGWIELMMGSSFAGLAERFDRAGFFKKIGIILVVLALIGLFFYTGFIIYRRYLE